MMNSAQGVQEYEITFLAKEDDSASEAEQILKEEGASIASSSDLGVKQLAYPIGALARAKYFNFIFELDPDNLPALEKKLRLAKTVVRYLLVKNPSHFIRPPKRVKSEGARAGKDEKASEPKPAESKKELSSEPTVKRQEAKPAPKEPKEELKEKTKAREEKTPAKPKAKAPATARKAPAKKAASSSELDAKLKELTGD